MPEEIKDGYTRREMYDDLYGAEGILHGDEWPPKDQSCAGRNHRRRVERNFRDENTR